ncbi:hypothetical protein KGQ20_19270 [Catenulispora sp. NF23]|uniref:Uncharacterized protein n=1 Tax=Catenulispora pinistramenti TaxID=2705254 RepID=A0ABS5L1K9_9ACTN|nr:hypothetical protein [Catenulispora pinistramenti]MBS2534914.1 hypothetical protein [Catenulispora pinistramenti]MBS2552201.1 hypothetical protein [Catenulispora pinistramenti]
MPDVVSVPEPAGREALARLLGYGQPAVAPGPVALSATGRVLFYVAAGGAEDLPELLEWLDWGGVRLDLSAVPAEELTDPPVRWLHPAMVPMQRPGGLEPEHPVGPADAADDPEDADGAARTAPGGSRRDAYPTPGLPEPPELIALLATIAAACHRLAVAAAR